MNKFTNPVEGNLFAIKIAKNKMLKKQSMLAASEGSLSLFEKEIAIMKKLDHPNIVKNIYIYCNCISHTELPL
jgi:serine/threonine protein kinase